MVPRWNAGIFSSSVSWGREGDRSSCNLFFLLTTQNFVVRFKQKMLLLWSFCLEIHYIQGDLESRNQDNLEGKFIGDLHFTKQGNIKAVGKNIKWGRREGEDNHNFIIWGCSGQEYKVVGNFIQPWCIIPIFLLGVPIMIIGHHILYGKYLELDQPFIAVNKESSPGTKAVHLDVSFRTPAVLIFF